MNSEVSHPAHYNSGKIEVIEAIEDWKLGFSRGNAVKYIARAGKKDPAKEIQDLEKAVWYIKRDIELLTAAKAGRETSRPNDMNPRNDFQNAQEIAGRLAAESNANKRNPYCGTDGCDYCGPPVVS